jgi:hypothetical protein
MNDSRDITTTAKNSQKTRTIVLAAATLVVIVLFSTTSSSSISSKTMAVAQQSDNNTTNTTTVTPSENTIKVNATEKNEVYRWQINGQTNPDLRLTANTDYTFTVQNPTDTKHELIIADFQGKEVATTGDIQPSSSAQLTFKPNMTSSGGGSNMIGYHCEYHPDQMKGSIQIVNQ